MVSIFFMPIGIRTEGVVMHVATVIAGKVRVSIDNCKELHVLSANSGSYRE